MKVKRQYWSCSNDDCKERSRLQSREEEKKQRNDD